MGKSKTENSENQELKKALDKVSVLEDSVLTSEKNIEILNDELVATKKDLQSARSIVLDRDVEVAKLKKEVENLKKRVAKKQSKISVS